MKNAIDAYLAFVYQSRSEKTGKTYQQALKTFVDIVGDDAPLTKDTYNKFLRETASMNPSTQALCRSAIKGLYHFQADTVGGIDTSFFQMSDKRYALKPSKSLIMFNQEGIQQTIDYVSTIRNAPEELRDRALILLLADSGLRISEACKLRVGDVDLREERVVVIGKGNKQAVVKISHRTAKAIQDYFLGGHPFSISFPLFIRHDKRAGEKVMPITPGYIWHYIKRRISEAGVDPKTIRIHDFRHHFVTIVYQTQGIKTAQSWARHERLETTNRYTHLVEDGGAAYDDVFNK
jgi:integrase/recombinase XerC